MSKNMAVFRCEASTSIGAGHAMRCSVLADALAETGWSCSFVTSSTTYEFIPSLNRFGRIDPKASDNNPTPCDLFVVDNYDLDASYERRFRPFAKKIMVIDDLADRPHDCDILLDQTYGRDSDDYRSLVPPTCEILTGSDYVLLRAEFTKLRPQALEKRKNTTEIKRILVSMGGSDPKNFTIKALKMIKESEFKGIVDIVLGFSAPHLEEVKTFTSMMSNQVVFHTNPNMAQLTYDADFAIGATGSSVWERYCLGLPTLLMLLADNQNFIYQQLEKNNLIPSSIDACVKDLMFYGSIAGRVRAICDGKGSRRVIDRVIDGLGA